MDPADISGDELIRPEKQTRFGTRFRVVHPLLWMAAGSVITLLLLSIVAATFLASGSALSEQAAMKSLLGSIEAYHKEYNHYPMGSEILAGPSHALAAEGKLLEVLMGNDDELNPRKIKFYSAPTARNGKRGLVKNDDGTIRNVDFQGGTYLVVMDLDEDGYSINPDPRPGALKKVPSRVLVYSGGPDNDPATWDDNVTSW